jgi:hypothetical protein
MARVTARNFPPDKGRIVFCCLLGLLAGPAFGQDTSASESTEDAAYRATVKDALAEYDARHFEEARILFQRAHEIEPNARTSRGIGMASFELRDYVTAVHALSAALVDNRKPLSPEQREHAQTLLERSRLFVDVYIVEVSPPDARVIIDGHPAEREPDGTVLLGFGNHIVEVTTPGYVVRTFPVSVRGGEHKELIVNLEPRPQAPPGLAEPPPSPTTAQTPPTASTTAAPRSGAGWLLASAGAALLGVAAGTDWIFESDQLASCRNPAEGERCSNESALETRRNVAMGATLGAGAAAVTMAVIGMVTGAAAPTSASLSCVVVPSGVSCTRAF